MADVQYCVNQHTDARRDGQQGKVNTSDYHIGLSTLWCCNSPKDGFCGHAVGCGMGLVAKNSLSGYVL